MKNHYTHFPSKLFASLRSGLSFLITILLFTAPLVAQNHLQIVNPDDWWWPFGEAGKIEEATISLEPKGLYTEVGLYLTISDEGLGWPTGMELEITLDFNLPPGSIVHDSWLWMPDGNIIVQAEVHDISKARQIYEDIVDRNRDPSILYEKGGSNYQIRIFPLFGGESRKIKITYLSPNDWSTEDIKTWLPTGIFNTSNEPLDQVKIVHIPSSEWANPRIEGGGLINFSPFNDPVFGPIEIAYLSGDQLNLPLNYAVDAPFGNENYYVGKWEDDQDKFYQLAYIPPTTPQLNTDNHLLFLIDYQYNNTELTSALVKQALKDNLSAFPEANNKFNFVYQGSSEVEYMYDEWTALTPENIEQSIDLLPTSLGGGTMQLLKKGINWANDFGSSVDIVLFSNGSQFSFWDGPNNAQKIISELEGADHRIHVLDFQSKNFELIDNWPNPVFFTTNHLQFYQELTNWTSAKFYSISEGSISLWQMLNDFIKNFSYTTPTYDLHTKLQDGFTFSRHNMHSSNNFGPDKPILQVGKYTGDFPMEIEFSAIGNPDFIYEEEWINESHTIQNDSLNREIWAGNEINFLEGKAATSTDVQEIVNLSIKERVLSNETAFLALDLENGGDICANCWEIGSIILIDVEEIASQELEIAVAPNPFTDYTQIKITRGNNSSTDDAIQNMRLFDSFGKLIRVFDPKTASLDETEYNISWNGTDDNGQKLPAGVYHFILNTNQQTYNIKLVLITT